jgi:hypothetical protein
LSRIKRYGVPPVIGLLAADTLRQIAGRAVRRVQNLDAGRESN